MKRRHFIALLGFCSIGGAAALWSQLFSFWQPRSKHTAQIVTAVTDLMFPGDGIPGAKELGIVDRILALADFQESIAKGVAWLDKQATRHGAADFLALNEAGRLAAVEAAFTSKDDAGRRFVYTLRLHAGQFYYAEPVIKAAFSYTGPPQPDGFPDFQDPPR